MITSALLMAVFAISGCSADSKTSTSSSQQEKIAMSTTITELTKIDQVVGEGRAAEAGLNVTVHYTGWLYDPAQPEGKGKKFDSSVDRGDPFNFFLGGGQVIRGWDEGVVGMKIGGKRTLLIPSEYGYGARGAGGVIPPNATLVFDVELLGVK
jgi:FKBP-type peptidyl-prolyl cis-trans isomerase FkpA